jgi:hypothetical protein
MALFSAAAQDIGGGMGAELSSSVQGLLGVPADQWFLRVRQFRTGRAAPRDAARVAGPEPVLNASADSCFAGELQACDELSFESPPMSAYARTGGGGVTQYAVISCTDLE